MRVTTNTPFLYLQYSRHRSWCSVHYDTDTRCTSITDAAQYCSDKLQLVLKKCLVDPNDTKHNDYVGYSHRYTYACVCVDCNTHHHRFALIALVSGYDCSMKNYLVLNMALLQTLLNQYPPQTPTLHNIIGAVLCFGFARTTTLC